ncbi:hypothetical protein EV363DRAFT_693838 [Boletus edulis]|nr:hypothetical protein EV363DRAFT_693838 [Boletus edulis]
MIDQWRPWLIDDQAVCSLTRPGSLALITLIEALLPIALTSPSPVHSTTTIAPSQVAAQRPQPFLSPCQSPPPSSWIGVLYILGDGQLVTVTRVTGGCSCRHWGRWFTRFPARPSL